MKIPVLLIFLILFFSAMSFNTQPDTYPPGNKKDSVVIPFEYKQSALYQQYTMYVLDSVIDILLKKDSVTLTIEGYAHQDEGNDTITKYLSLNRALFIRSYVYGRGIDSSRVLTVIAHGKTRQLYRGTKNMGLGNCRAVITLNYPPPGKPYFDRDGDNISDSLDVCPDVFGEFEREGCPDSAIIVPFETEQTSLHMLTYKVLDSVIVLLKNNPSYTIAIEGHSFATEGTNTLCERLAKDRAHMVKGYLVSRFIPASRIDAITVVGTRKPITAARNPQEILRNIRAQIYLNKHE